MVRGIFTVPLQTFFKLADVSRIHVATDGNWLKSRADVMPDCIFFAMSILNRWNSLSESVVQVNSVNCFKNQLDKLRSNQMDFFMDE